MCVNVGIKENDQENLYTKSFHIAFGPDGHLSKTVWLNLYLFFLQNFLQNISSFNFFVFPSTKTNKIPVFFEQPKLRGSSGGIFVAGGVDAKTPPKEAVGSFFFATCEDMGVSKNRGVSPQIIHLFIGFSIINHPFWGTTIFGNTHM